MPLQFRDSDLGRFPRPARRFQPRGLLNPGKILPTPRACSEVRDASPSFSRKIHMAAEGLEE